MGIENIDEVIQPFTEDEKLKEYNAKLNDLRKDGVLLISSLREEITATKKNKMLDVETRQKIIADHLNKIEVAKKVAAENSAEEKRVVKEAVNYSNSLAIEYEKKVVAAEDKKIALLKEEFVKEVEGIKQVAAQKKQNVLAEFNGKPELKEELASCKYELDSSLYDAKSRLIGKITKCRDTKFQAYVDRVQSNRALRNGKTAFGEDTLLYWKGYANKFTASKFFIENSLYLAIVVFFIVCVILAPITGNGNLLSLPNIFTILEQSSVRMFYALGVAGLILIAGTDLSVGRMVALGSVITGLLLHPGKNIVTFFKMGPWDFTSLPMGSRVLIALFLSIILCVAFSIFAGFFTAKFKMHPFISTLATQLIIYGLLFFGTSGTPVGSIDSNIKDMIGGRWVLGIVGGELVTFPKLIVPAIVAIFVAWFIWNKTIFGKNMYAVGGNAEAASVSGINVFWTTLCIFIMAGVFYGCGAFLEAFKANASAGTGQGYELDAIAACVVGGISFNGGIGKIGGAVLGVIIFTSLTYCLTFLGIDTNLQFVFKGLIIVVAVALDCVKYLKKK